MSEGVRVSDKNVLGHICIRSIQIYSCFFFAFILVFLLFHCLLIVFNFSEIFLIFVITLFTSKTVKATWEDTLHLSSKLAKADPKLIRGLPVDFILIV